MGENGEIKNIERGPTATEMLDAQVRNILAIVLRGIMVSSPGVSPQMVLNAICRQTGSLCAGSIAGELAGVLAHRAGFKKAFEEGVQKAPLVQPPKPQPAPSTRMG